MRKGLIKFIARVDIQEALRDNDLRYCYENLENLEKLVNANKVSSGVMPGFTSVLLAAGFDPLNYTDKIYRCQYHNLPLTDINIPSNIKNIGYCAFWDCKKLKEVIIPDSVTSIDGGAFYGCSSIMNIEIPDSVASIGGGAFEKCLRLKNVTIKNGVKSIGNGAFSDCKGLTNIVIPDSVNSIGAMAFSGCTSLTDVTIPQRFKNEKDLRKSFGDLINKINFTFI